jgi:hypothetical protein
MERLPIKEGEVTKKTELYNKKDRFERIHTFEENV